MCGTKVFKKELIETILLWDENLYFKDPFGDFNFIFAATSIGDRIVDYPIHYRSRKYGSPQISRFRDGYKLFLNFKFNHKTKCFKILKKFDFDKLLSLLIVASFVYSSFYNLLFFELNNSPDYEYYFSYIETFFNINEKTNLEQGLIYHFLISLVLVLSESSINGPNVDIYISNAIHLVNNMLFLIGLIGTNKLLKYYSIKSVDRKIFILMSIFLPFVMQARFHYKPEIFAIAFVPWLFFNILKYLKDRKIENLIISIIIFVGTAFLKGNIFTMLMHCNFLGNYKRFKKISLNHFSKATVCLFAFSIPLIFENQKFNGTNLFSNTQKRINSEVYENTVSSDFFTNFSFYKFIRKPNFDPENVNFFSTIFVDTFNDFFGVSWNIDNFPMAREYYLFER